MRYRAGGRERGQAHCGWGRLSVSRIVPTHRPLQNYRLTVSDRERAGESERQSEGWGKSADEESGWRGWREISYL